MLLWELYWLKLFENPQGKSMEEIVKTANIVGGITTTKIGALESIPTWGMRF